MAENKKLSATGYKGEPVPNQFTLQARETDKLAVVLPGFGYHADLPVLYYPGLIAMDAGYDLLRVNYTYSQNPGYSRASDAEQQAWIDADVQSAITEGLKQRDYRSILLIGKSLGTMAMGGLLEHFTHLPNPGYIWLTPVLSDPRLLENIRRYRPRSLFAMGTADHYYNPSTLNELVSATQGEQIIVQNANHSLEVPGQVEKTLQALVKVMTAVDGFVQASAA